jgi:hypothetical protein
MKKNGFISFLALGLYALGAIGGSGWSLYNQTYVVAVGVVALAVMAWPTLVKHYKRLFVED